MLQAVVPRRKCEKPRGVPQESIKVRSAVSAPNQPPSAGLSASVTSGPAPLDVDFNAGSSTDPDGTITGYEWDFGDGQGFVTGSATEETTFTVPGTYTVRVRVSDNVGATDTTSMLITVNNPPAVQMIARWDFEDGNGVADEILSGTAVSNLLVGGTGSMSLLYGTVFNGYTFPNKILKSDFLEVGRWFAFTVTPAAGQALLPGQFTFDQFGLFGSSGQFEVGYSFGVASSPTVIVATVNSPANGISGTTHTLDLSAVNPGVGQSLTLYIRCKTKNSTQVGYDNIELRSR